jgi:type IX secretion system PorP/SprF family membrane protein
MRKLLYLVLSLSLLIPTISWGQQDPQFSMYMFNRMVLNPAYAGARGALNLTAVGRSQWVGIDGHPNTFTLSGDAGVNALHGGVGAHLMYDEIGPIQTIGLKAAYAFRFDFGKERGEGPALQIGLSPGFY